MYDFIHKYQSTLFLTDKKNFKKVKIAGYGMCITWDDKISYDGAELRKLAEKQRKTIENTYFIMDKVING